MYVGAECSGTSSAVAMEAAEAAALQDLRAVVAVVQHMRHCPFDFLHLHAVRESPQRATPAGPMLAALSPVGRALGSLKLTGCKLCVADAQLMACVAPGLLELVLVDFELGDDDSEGEAVMGALAEELPGEAERWLRVNWR
jgi:hypothetical protein